MGLDMYLKKHIYIGANYDHNEVTGEISLKTKNKPIKVNLKKVSYIVEEAAYWRKSNSIHKWFVDNVQEGEDDCKEYYVSKEQLQELLDLCKKVLKNPKENQHLLPPKSGFFFGSTDNLDEYIYDLKRTIKQLKEVLKEKEGIFDYYYQSSW